MFIIVTLSFCVNLIFATNVICKGTSIVVVHSKSQYTAKIILENGYGIFFS